MRRARLCSMTPAIHYSDQVPLNNMNCTVINEKMQREINFLFLEVYHLSSCGLYAWLYIYVITVINMI